ncbi:MAG TPA: hypothetical protein VD694_06735, partial [Nitrososphaeraceae archaeon]|nr:hypothetical protein [Nitrososphaeraceae archaeon]
FEAKQVKQGNIEYYLNIGWHKFAYAGVRFLNYSGLNIYPIYFLRFRNKVYLFIFTRFDFHKNGVILNHPNQMKPQQVFVILLEN